MNKDEIMNQLKKILKKYPDKQREILLYIFGRDNLIKMINEPTYEELLKENKELKLELSGYRQAILNDKEMLGLKEENDKLKKQLKEYKDNYNCLLNQKKQFEYIMSKQVDYQGQQKEFINYLEDEIKRITTLDETKVSQGSIMTMRCMKSDYEEILQKYKEIIGVSDDKTN